MRKITILTLTLFLLIGMTSGVLAANSLGLGYGFFEGEGGVDVDGLILSSDSDFGDDYNLTSRYFIGDGEGNYEADLLDLNVYKKMNSQSDTDFYLGAGWKWLIEDNVVENVDLSSSSWGIPISAKMESRVSEKVTLGGKIDYWFFGSYDVDLTNTNTGETASYDDDFTGFGIDIYAKTEVSPNVNIKVGYANEDYTYESGPSEADSGFDGFYFAGEVMY